MDLQPAGWRLVPHAGRDERRAGSLLASDLDALEEAAVDYAGPLKLQLLGPWSLVAQLELERGARALTDVGAVRDVAASLAAGLARHLVDIRSRMPGVEALVVQLDEPLLGAVLEGGLPTPSGWGRLAAVPEPLVQEVLGVVLDAVAGSATDAASAAGSATVLAIAGVRARGPAMAGVVRRAGAGFWGVDATDVEAVDENETAEAVEAGLGFMVEIAVEGAEAAALQSSTGAPALQSVTGPVRQLWRRVGLDPPDGLTATVLAPRPGLERLDITAAEKALKTCRDAARLLVEAVGQDAP